MTLLDRNYLVRFYRGLSELERTSEIRIVGISLEEVDEATFKGLANLKVINLFNCDIQGLPLNVFSNCIEYLRELILSGNKLTKIEAALFRGLRNLETLDLAYNQIENVHEESFRDLISLKRLNLTSNKLNNIQRKCFKSLNSNSIEWVYLQANNFDPDVCCYIRYKLSHYRRVTSDWDEFLKQFPDEDGSKNEIFRSTPIIFQPYNVTGSFNSRIKVCSNSKRNYCSTCLKKFRSKKAIATHIRFSHKHQIK